MALVLSHLLPSHLTTWVQYIATMRTNSACNSGVSKKKAGGVNVESVFLLFRGSTHHSLSHRDVLRLLAEVRNEMGHGP